LVHSSHTHSSSSKSSFFLAIALTITMLYFGRRIFIPLALALVLSFLLTPVVGALEKARLGRVPSVLIVVVLCCGMAGGVAWGVASQFVEIMDHIGDYRNNLVEKVHSLRPATHGPISKATATVRELNKELTVRNENANSGPNSDTSGSRPIPVQVVATPSNAIDDLKSLLGPIAEPLATIGVVIIFTAFTLTKREDLRNRLIRLGGEGRLHVVTQALDEASRRLSRYLWLQFVVNVCYGTVFGMGLYVIGIPHAFLWGALEALLRFVPYVGTLLGASFPIALSLAVFPGWTQALLAFALFVVMEVIVANAIEPWLYGSNIGISSLAILVAAVFWTMLWGFPGLILSTPVTLCLMLAGRYVPRLHFLEVVLGDEPVLTPGEHFYQRMLAMDADEAREIAEVHLKDRTLESLYETVLIPALELAEQDRHMEAIDRELSDFILQNTRELIEDLGDHYERQRLNVDDATRRGPMVEKPSIVCIPAHDDSDELIATMLAQLLRLQGSNAIELRVNSIEAMLEQVDQHKCRIACVSALPPFAVGHARLLCRKLRARFPEIKVIVGLWSFSGSSERAGERVGADTDAAATTLAEAISHIRRLAQTSLLGSRGDSVKGSRQFPEATTH
jgi:predicted PurR-regulated permease PerM